MVTKAMILDKWVSFALKSQIYFWNIFEFVYALKPNRIPENKKDWNQTSHNDNQQVRDFLFCFTKRQRLLKN